MLVSGRVYILLIMWSCGRVIRQPFSRWHFIRAETGWSLCTFLGGGLDPVNNGIIMGWTTYRKLTLAETNMEVDSLNPWKMFIFPIFFQHQNSSLLRLWISKGWSFIPFATSMSSSSDPWSCQWKNELHFPKTNMRTWKLSLEREIPIGNHH